MSINKPGIGLEILKITPRVLRKRHQILAFRYTITVARMQSIKANNIAGIQDQSSLIH